MQSKLVALSQRFADELLKSANEVSKSIRESDLEPGLLPLAVALLPSQLRELSAKLNKLTQPTRTVLALDAVAQVIKSTADVVEQTLREAGVQPNELGKAWAALQCPAHQLPEGLRYIAGEFERVAADIVKETEGHTGGSR